MMKMIEEAKEEEKINYFNIPCYAYGTTGETKQIEPAILIRDAKQSVSPSEAKTQDLKAQDILPVVKESSELKRGLHSATGGTVAN